MLVIGSLERSVMLTVKSSIVRLRFLVGLQRIDVAGHAAVAPEDLGILDFELLLGAGGDGEDVHLEEVAAMYSRMPGSRSRRTISW